MNGGWVGEDGRASVRDKQTEIKLIGEQTRSARWRSYKVREENKVFILKFKLALLVFMDMELFPSSFFLSLLHPPPPPTPRISYLPMWFLSPTTLPLFKPFSLLSRTSFIRGTIIAELQHINTLIQRWEQVTVLQVTSKSQVFLIKSRVNSQVKTCESQVESKVKMWKSRVRSKSSDQISNSNAE